MNFEKSQLSAFHVTCVLHNSRISQRMIDYNVQLGGCMYLSIEEESYLIELLCVLIKKDGLRILALNFCVDHLHFIIACNHNHLESIVGKLKSKSARSFNIWKGLTVPVTRGHAPLSSRGETQNSFWAQKFNRVQITNEQHLFNAMYYVEHNREKHGLAHLTEVSTHLIRSIIIPFEKAFE
jgi:REP element-mobilizing transposase RayT